MRVEVLIGNKKSDVVVLTNEGGLLASELANLRVLNAYLKISGYNITKVEFEVAKLESISNGYITGEVGYFTEKKEEKITDYL